MGQVVQLYIAELELLVLKFQFRHLISVKMGVFPDIYNHNTVSFYVKLDLPLDRRV